jgi:hypothetical protein
MVDSEVENYEKLHNDYKKLMAEYEKLKLENADHKLVAIKLEEIQKKHQEITDIFSKLTLNN